MDECWSGARAHRTSLHVCTNLVARLGGRRICAMSCAEAKSRWRHYDWHTKNHHTHGIDTDTLRFIIKYPPVSELLHFPLAGMPVFNELICRSGMYQANSIGKGGLSYLSRDDRTREQSGSPCFVGSIRLTRFWNRNLLWFVISPCLELQNR